MSKLITKGVIQQEEIQRITDDLYIPAAKLIDYTLEPNENKIIIYSHAGIGIEIIKALAEKLNVVYNDTTADELARTIDRINREFIKNIKGNTINEIVNTDTLYSGLTLQQIDKEKSPIEFLLWNRDYHDLERPAKHNNYEMHFVHGHDSQELNSENITVLNSDLGKDLKLNKGTYESLLSTNVRRLNQNNNLSSTPLRGLGEEISQNPPAAKSSHSFFTRPTKEVGAGTAINLTAVAAAVGVMGLMAANGPGSAILTATAVTVAGASISTGGLALAIGLAVLGAIGTGLIIKGLHDHHQNNKQNTKGKRSQSEPNIYVCPDDLTLGFK